LDELAPYLLDVPEPPTPIDPSLVFSNSHPIEIEVGFGKGLFLLMAAQACPDVNFLGIEIVRKYQLFTATRLAKRHLRNVRLLKTDARTFLRDCVVGDSLQAVHVYFPDPWWKRRHWKRRVFTPEFAGQCERVLRRGGRLHVATDVAAYFDSIRELVAQHTRLQSMTIPAMSEPSHDLDYLTNFDRKFRKSGKPVYRARWERSL
jgi:tRNA (guanine-N7-)-methyltransferase